MSNQEKEKFKILIDKHKSKMPWYIIEYAEMKTALSPATLYAYITEFEKFLKWLISNRLAVENGKVVTNICNVPISTLENLPLNEARTFQRYLQGEGIETRAINRTFSALKSLFKYLAQNTENEQGENYISRNVMEKIELHKEKVDAAARADDVANMIFNEKDDVAFLQFLANDYGEMLKHISPKKYSFFQRDKERDIAIISLILGTGLRVSEVASLTISSINFRQGKVKVTRKGNKRSSVLATRSCLDDIQEYIKVRPSKYNCPQDEDLLFVTNYKGKYTQLTVRAIQKLCDKYSSAFDEKRSPHKLRHTYATNHYKENKDLVLLRDQLGHTSVEVTSIYTNINNEKKREAIERLERRQFE
ncbi:tyrosine recombinase XerS [Bacillus thuringiensis]|uniref:tyrosine recombinase XerS n=1 Tax=Bacillus thuringiensis TaxID=1428 RepID=UPI000BFE298B|nr:tyrosine recombinase XerS [Bacillus thuringiensis]PGL80365.1 tyrosine recombinase XerS [Bacillus thuringiensis]PGT81142.1 tyrosine recombinase XerS [Bacillus thuringiensis]PGZ65494.1 tyrosine recombinase XerS [Bacillus thuringiensis]